MANQIKIKFLNANETHDEAEALEVPCPNSIATCPRCRASALAAGIPASVIDGRRKLRELFDSSYIDHMRNKQ